MQAPRPSKFASATLCFLHICVLGAVRPQGSCNSFNSATGTRKRAHGIGGAHVAAFALQAHATLRAQRRRQRLYDSLRLVGRECGSQKAVFRKVRKRQAGSLADRHAGGARESRNQHDIALLQRFGHSRQLLRLGGGRHAAQRREARQWRGGWRAARRKAALGHDSRTRFRAGRRRPR